MKINWQGMWDELGEKIGAKKRQWSGYQLTDLMNQIEKKEIRRAQSEVENEK